MQQSEICCVCIRTNLELISIMEADPNTIKYSCKLNQCVPEVVWSEDSRICEQCIEQLEAACAFRDLCLQSHTIRRQLLERSVQVQDVQIHVEDIKIQVEDVQILVEDVQIQVQELKTEEITIDDEDVPIKVEMDQDAIKEFSSVQKSPINEPEFANIKSFYTLPQEDTRDDTNKNVDNEIPNKSYLRDLLQTPQELLKVKNYTVNNNYTQYMKPKIDENSNRPSPGDLLETNNDISDDDDDDILFVEPKENDNVLNTSNLRGFLQTTQCEKVHSLSQTQSEYAKEETTEKQTIDEKPSEKCLSDTSEQTKAYNLDEDGIELIEDNANIGCLNKSLLRDLLLKPHKNYTSQNDNFQYVEVKGNEGVDSKNSQTFNPSDPLQTGQELLKLEKSYFENRIKRLPDARRTEYYQCKHCAVKFKERRNLTRHNKEIHQFDRPWDCIYCTKSFKTLPELKQHEKAHLNQRKYECSVCCRSYNTTSILAKHKIIKHKSPKEWRYICPHCDQKYPFKAYRDQHIRRNHTNAGNEYICFHCNTGFSSKLLLIAHIRYKHNLENVMKQCHICQNTYINQAELEGHMLQRHNLETIKFPKKIKKYKCDKCSKLYTTLKAKNSHYDKCDGIRRHTFKKIADVKVKWTPR